jgi:hypothetical protein
MKLAWQNAMTAEYGITSDCAGARVWSRICRTVPVNEQAPRIPSAGLYVGICRRLSRRAVFYQVNQSAVEGETRIDGRLVACGWNYYSPSDWMGVMSEERSPLESFVDYWRKTQPRPDVVGSYYNADPLTVFHLWRAGVPVRDTSRMGVWAEHALAGGTRVVWRLIRRTIRMSRAMSRASARTHGPYLHIRESGQNYGLTAKTWAALGRVSPEMQEAMLAELEQLRENGKLTGVVRVRDLPWEIGARVQKAIMADRTGRVRIAWSIGQRQEKLLADCIGAKPQYWTIPSYNERAVALLSPSYPKVTWEQSVRLCRGESPVQLSGGILTRAEAHAWLNARGDIEPVEWLCSVHFLPHVRSIAIARWLLSVKQRGHWDALIREHEFAGPAGQRLMARFIDRVDEIQDVDLDRGATTGVERAFNRAANRVRHLCTPAALVREGEEMHHCVAGYEDAVSRGQSVILAISVRGHRSTVELSAQGRILQHRGPRNADPHPLCHAVMQRFMSRNRLGRRAA